MKIVMLNWCLSGFFVALGVYLVAAVLQSMFKSILGKKISFTFGVIAACSIYTAVTWDFYVNQIGLSTLFPWMGWLTVGCVGLAAGNYGYGHRNSLNVGVCVQGLKPLASFLLFFIVLAVLYSLFVVDFRLPVVLTGNSDIWSYSKITHLVLHQPMGNNIVGYDLLKNGAADQTPTSYLFLAGLAYFLGKEVIDVLGLGMILILTLSAYMVKKLCVEHWNIRGSLASLIALTLVTSSFSFYLASNYFLAQWIGICIFLAMVLIAFRKEETLWLRTVGLSLLSYLMFMSYPPLFFPYMGILVFAKGVDAWFSKCLTGTDFFNKNFASVLYAFPIALLIMCGLDFTHFKAMVLRIMMLGNVDAGWPFRLLNPLLFLEIPCWQIDSGHLILKIIGYFVIIAGICTLTYKAYKGKKLSPEQFSLSTVFASSVVVYLSYYALVGASYQQWKFAGSILLPLSFLAMARVVSTLEGCGALVQRTLYAVFIMLVAGNIFIMETWVAIMSPLMKKNAPLRELIQIDQDPHVKRVMVDLKDDYTGTMVATQFINRKPLTLLSQSYFSADVPAKYTEMLKGCVLLSNSCNLFANRGLTMLGPSFCLIQGDIRWAEKYSLSFNEPLPSVFGATGLSGLESWGRWNDGHQVKLEIPVNKKWRGILVILKGVPFLPSGITRQRLSFSVRGIILKKISVNAETEITLQVGRRLFEGGHVSLAINLPDAVSPSVGGSGETRVLGFGFHSLTVEAKK